MTDSIANSEAGRIHGLDAYRGVLVSLGVVLHTSLFLIAGDVGGWNEEPFSLWMLPIMWCNHTIHLFRMPAFFVLSGFFGALLWQRRGARATIQNRFERLFLPLIVVAMLLEPVRVASFKLTEAYMQGASDVFAPVAETLNEATWVPELYHLWFLNYLVWIVALTLPLVAFIERVWPIGWRPHMAVDTLQI